VRSVIRPDLEGNFKYDRTLGLEHFQGSTGINSRYPLPALFVSPTSLRMPYETLAKDLHEELGSACRGQVYVRGDVG